LGFPAIFRGDLKVRTSKINEKMKVVAVYAIGSIISEEELNEEYIIPDDFDHRVVEVDPRQLLKQL